MLSTIVPHLAQVLTLDARVTPHDRRAKMAKKRTAISAAIAEQVLFDADLSCCVCQERGNHVHHLDENPSNNELANLVLLCFLHHDEVTAKGGLSRRLTPNLLVR